ncbi:hypothetical protein Hanom_Chr08g00700201 [Helianthus anomalus]
MICYLPNTELGVINDIISHSKLCLVFRRVEWFNLPDDAPLRQQFLSMIHRNIGKHCDDERVDRLGLAEALGESNHTFPVVTVSGQEGDVGTARQRFCLHQTGCHQSVGGVFSDWWSHGGCE